MKKWSFIIVAMIITLSTANTWLPTPSTLSASTPQIQPTAHELTLGYFVPDETGTHFRTITQEGDVQFEKGRVLLYLASGETITIEFQASNPASRPQGQKPLEATANYYRGTSPHQWREDVVLYQQLLYPDLYPGIDLRYTILNSGLKSEFIIHPGAALKSIQCHYTGIKQLRISGDNLQILTNDDAMLSEHIPHAYQEYDGQRQPVTARFHLLDTQTYGFNIQETLIPGAKLVIDPELVYATYFGGLKRDEGWAITTDYVGHSYIAGVTYSQDLPVMNPIQPYSAGNDNKDVFIAKFDVQGNLIYATYYGGTDGEEGNAIATDAEGNAYITGQTTSANLPMYHAWQADFAGHEDAYVLKLGSQGKMEWATYIGGQGFEEANAITVDHLNRVYIGGEVYSDDFPLRNPWQSMTYGEGEEDGFISIFDTEGQLIYSTYISAPHRDQIFSMTVDQTGNVYATGMTSSPNFPVHNAAQADYGGGREDCLVIKLDPWNNEMDFATFLGGVDRDVCTGIDFDQTGNVYVAGDTLSINFPVLNAHQPHHRGNYDAFVTKLSPSGRQIHYSTFLGGSEVDHSWGLVSDHLGHVYVAGHTKSPDFPIYNAIQTSFGGEEDGFIVVLTPKGLLHEASYLGGAGKDRIWDITLDGNWITHVTGASESPNLLTTTDAYQQSMAGATDMFLTRLAFIPTPIPTSTPIPTPTPTPYASAEIGTEGGILWITYPDHLTLLRVPADTLSGKTVFELIYDDRSNIQGDLQGLNHFFKLEVNPPENIHNHLHLELAYDETRVFITDSLTLYSLDDSTWVTSNITITEQLVGHISARIKQPGIYGILGRTNRLYLPLTMRQD